MNENTKFTILLDMLNRRIADLNIRISRDDSNKECLEKQLDDMLKDREILYSGEHSDFVKILKKYGETFND